MVKKLLSIRLRATFLAAISGKSKNGEAARVSKKKLVLFAFLYAFLALTFFALIFATSFPLGNVLIANGGENLYFGLFMILSFTAVFILSVFETKSELFECKDNDLLFSMPIKPRDIMFSRIFAVLFYNYLIELVIMIPVIISYAVLGGEPIGIVGGIYVLMTLPAIATALSVGVGYLVHIISAKVSRFRNVIVIILSMGFLALYMFGYTALMENLEGIISDIDANFEKIAETYSAVGAIGGIALMHPTALAIYTVLGAVIIIAAIEVISKNYIKAITNTAKTVVVAYKEKKLSKKNSFRALCGKEFARFLSSPIYIMNGGLGLIFEIVLAFVIAFGGASILEFGSASMVDDPAVIESITALLSPIVIAGLVFCQAMTMISSSALSLEGNNLWILNSMPVKSETVLLSKCAPHAILGVCASVISGIAVSFGLQFKFFEAILCVLLLSASSLAFALLGVIINTLVPKFEFTNEAEVIKQSMATFLDMLANMILAALLFVAAIILMPIMKASLFMLLATCAFLIFDFLMYYIIVGPISKKYDAL